MTEDNKDPLRIGHWPKWKQIAFFVLALTILMAATKWIAQSIESHLGSPQSRKIKAQIEPIAEQLEAAQKVGDRQSVIALLDPATKIVRDYNDLEDAKKSKINQSPLRYCVLAAVNLGDGITEVTQTGNWTSKSKYDAAMDACK